MRFKPLKLHRASPVSKRTAQLLRRRNLGVALSLVIYVFFILLLIFLLGQIKPL